MQGSLEVDMSTLAEEEVGKIRGLTPSLSIAYRRSTSELKILNGLGVPILFILSRV